MTDYIDREAFIADKRKQYWKCEGKGQYYCALCNKPATTDLYSYCPWCGADMIGEHGATT